MEGRLDKKAVIREGSDAASLLLAGERTSLLRRQIARLDEASALALVLEQLRAGMAAHPAMVPRAVTRTRKEIRKLMEHERSSSYATAARTSARRASRLCFESPLPPELVWLIQRIAAIHQ